MRFCGREYFRENNTDATSPHLGDSLEKEIQRTLPAAAADAQALAKARAEDAKRVRDEERAIARLLGKDEEF